MIKQQILRQLARSTFRDRQTHYCIYFKICNFTAQKMGLSAYMSNEWLPFAVCHNVINISQYIKTDDAQLNIQGFLTINVQFTKRTLTQFLAYITPSESQTIASCLSSIHILHSQLSIRRNKSSHHLGYIVKFFLDKLIKFQSKQSYKN